MILSGNFELARNTFVDQGKILQKVKESKVVCILQGIFILTCFFNFDL